MAKLEIPRSSSALLLLDVQVGILGFLDPQYRRDLLANMARAIKAARSAGLRVIHVTVCYRKGYPDASARNKVIEHVMKAGRLIEGSDSAKICPEIEVLDGDILITKRRMSAFFGTDLDIILRIAGIDTLILTGVSTLMTVEATARAAFERDFHLIALSDCCGDRDQEANEAALRYVMPRVATVCTTDEFAAAIA